MSKAAFGLLWCFVFVMPWEEVVSLPVWGSIPRLAGVVALAFGVLHILARGSIRPLTWFHRLAAVFVLWTGVSGLWSIDPEASQTRFITYAQLAVLAWLIWQIAWSPEHGRALLQAYIWGACVAAVATIYNYVSGVSVYAQGARYTSLNSNPNELGITLALGLTAAWYVSLSAPDERVAWKWQLYLPLGVTAIFLTGSRGAFATTLVALAIIPWTAGRLPFRARAVLYALAAGSLVLAGSVAPQATLERIRSGRADAAAGNFGGRGIIWKSGLQVAQEHSLLGVGAGAFMTAIEPTRGRRESSHQTFLSILVEDGVVGLSLFLLMLGAALQPTQYLPLLQRRFSTVMVAALVVGSLSAALDYRKQLWFMLGLLAAQAALRPAWTASTPTVVRAWRRLRPAVGN